MIYVTESLGVSHAVMNTRLSDDIFSPLHQGNTPTNSVAQDKIIFA